MCVGAIVDETCIIFPFIITLQFFIQTHNRGEVKMESQECVTVLGSVFIVCKCDKQVDDLVGRRREGDTVSALAE